MFLEVPMNTKSVEKSSNSDLPGKPARVPGGTIFEPSGK